MGSYLNTQKKLSGWGLERLRGETANPVVFMRRSATVRAGLGAARETRRSHQKPKRGDACGESDRGGNVIAQANPVLREIKFRRTVGDDAATKIRTADVAKKISH